MRTKIICMALLVYLFTSCEDIYKPVLDEVPDSLVIEAHLTNDPNQNFVRLSMTRNFSSTDAITWLTGAKVDLLETGYGTNTAVENSQGNYVFPNVPVYGRKYMLRVSYDKNVYESETVVMPPPPTIDSLYTNDKIETSYRTDAYGSPTLTESPGREICIDAPITKALEYYRFYWRAILEWQYNPPSKFGPPPPSWYCWLSLYGNDEFNLAGPKEFSVSNQIKNHQILFLNYNEQVYLDSIQQIAMGWIVIIDQYGITKSSYDFHDQLNKQFAADGSLFDPILTQINGNFHCKNDPTKIVMGFFDLNSYRQYRYYMNFGIDEKSTVIQRRLNRYLAIPSTGQSIGVYPSFWEFPY